jgi:hypothetical protein
MNKKASLFIIGVIVAAAWTMGSFFGHKNGYQDRVQSEPASMPDNSNAVVWNTTGLYAEMEDQQAISALSRCTPVVIEDVAGDFYFVRVEENGVVIASGWASVYNIRLYPDFSNGVECDE